MTVSPVSNSPSNSIDSAEGTDGSTTFHPGDIAAQVSSILPVIEQPDIVCASTAKSTISESERPVHDALSRALIAAHASAELDFIPWPIGTSLTISQPNTEGRGNPFFLHIEETCDNKSCSSPRTVLGSS